MPSYVVHIIGLMGNGIGFIYVSSRYLGTGYGSTVSTWGISNEVWGLCPMLLSALGILINGLFLSVQKNFNLLVLFTSVLILNSIYILSESIYYVNENSWLYGQKLLLETPQIHLAFLISSMILLFVYRNP